MRPPTTARGLLLCAAVAAIGLFAVTGSASAATSSAPRDCAPPAFAGSIEAQAAGKCVPVPPVCRDPRARGLRGVTGATGARGKVGATGRRGVAGPVGPAGVDGATGPAGATGAPGPAGGPGATGLAGATGPAGAIGPAGTNGLAEYAYIYNTAGATIAIEADVPFDTNGVMTSGITHAPGATGVTLVNAGTYAVTFSLSGVEPNQMAIFRNGVVVPGSIYGSGAGTQLTTGTVIVTAGAGDVLTLRNHSSAAAVGLQTLAGGTQSNSNASLLIEKLA